MNNEKSFIESAREMVDVYRKKDLNDPEIAAQFSESLNELSNCLGEEERWEEAALVTYEALKFDRKLALEIPDHFFYGLTSIENHWNNLRKLKRFNEALIVSKNAIEDLKILKGKSPWVDDWIEARLLHLYSESLWETGSRKESFDVAEQEIKIHRSETDNHKKTSLLTENYFRLARALESLAQKLVLDNQFEESFDAYAELILIYKNIIKIQPIQKYLWEFSNTMSDYAIALKKAGRKKEYLTTLREVIEINRKLCDGEKSNYSGLTNKEIQEIKVLLENIKPENLNGFEARDEKQKVLRRAGEILWKAGHQDAALKIMLARINIFKQAYPIDNNPYLEDIAYDLNNYCIRLIAADRLNEALEICNESIEIKTMLTNRNFDKHADSLVNSLQNKSLILSKMKLLKESIPVIEKALEISRKYYLNDNKEFSLNHLAICLNSYALRLKEAGQVEAALTTVSEEIEIRIKLTNTEEFRFGRLNDLANSLTFRSDLFNELNQISEAIKTSLEGINIQREVVLKKPSEYFYSCLLKNLKKYQTLLNEAGSTADAKVISEEILEVDKKHKIIEKKYNSGFKSINLKNLELSLLKYRDELREDGEHEESEKINKELISLRLEMKSYAPYPDPNLKTFL